MGDADDTSEAKTQVAVNSDIYPCSKSCAKRRQTRYLSPEIVFEFLSRIPAQVLLDVMRHACREWSLMIRNPNFILHHLRNSTPGIMILDRCLFHSAIYIEMQRGSLEIYTVDIGFPSLLLSSCNGLALASDYFGDRYTRHVINPLTKQQIVLPRFLHKLDYYAKFGLAVVEASLEYKVVHTYDDEPCYSRTKIVVITIGVDKDWRLIDIEYSSRTTRRALMSTPLVTGGYIHWTDETFVYTLNVETETIHLFPIPQLPKKRRHFLPMGGNLSILSESKEFLWDVWEMNSETGEWTLLRSFDLKPMSYSFTRLFCKYTKSIIPFGWLVVREVLVFSTTGFQRRCITYNIKTGEILSFELDTNTLSRHFQPHVHSLVRLEGEF